MNRYFLPLLLAMCLAPALANAHAPDQSYLYLSIYKSQVEGYFELTAEDMNKALDLGLPEQISLDQLRPHIPAIQAYIRQHASFAAGGQNFPIRFTETEVLDIEEEEFAADYGIFHFELDDLQEVPDVFDIRYDLLVAEDRKHTGWLIMQHNWKAGILANGTQAALIFGRNSTEQQLDLTDTSVWRGFWTMLKQGVWHIWIGLDHILFIIALILPSVVRRRKPTDPASQKSWEWVPVESFREAFWYILRIVTFFTIAHSLTLALAALGIIDLPGNIVEGVIALSIGLAALHNITPVFTQKEWVIAFAFGLFHGFGFAGVLGEKGLSGDFMIYSLLGFNLGVEIGQVFIVCLSFPILFLVRRQPWYPGFIKWGSMGLIFISLYWTIERFFGLDFRVLSKIRTTLGI